MTETEMLKAPKLKWK